tara:strand:- start:1426 stop:2175 length:750 start_codon:yes stop_codon:yes gene_type:complete
MFQPNQEQMSSNSRAGAAIGFDAGLRQYMMGVYNYMVSALLLTGVVAYFAGTNEAFLSMMINQNAEGTAGLSPLAYILMFAPLGVVFYLSFRMHKMSFSEAKMWFFGYAFLMGLSLFYVFAIFTGTSIARVFFITAGMFGAMSMIGYTTKRDLTGMGSFLMMGVIGLIIASVVNMFLQSTMMHFILSVVSVLVFAGLTAYDTQKLKAMYAQVAGNAELVGKSTIMGALALYIDFIVMFQNLLHLFGNRN